MAHYCICPKCGQKFDRDKIQAVQVAARRYGHATCYPDNKEFIPLVKTKEEDEDYVKLMDYINQLFGKNANYAQIKRQLKIYTEENKYSYSGIMKSLIYFYQIKGNSTDKANGALGIVPFVYQDAYNYYYNLFMAQQANKDKTLITKIKEIIIKPPKSDIKKKKLFDLGEETDEE